ncbi:MAG: helix-turn-helix transcriptional regulator [Francisellaceae bacterium]|jgi:transcriptional regulator with XRE-family HTH domain|nr:helix-turn-helix transcriptional regulator [Francisellaceae bacterium]MBT6538155.1 helix-turn-helix transcriptional regulator [Francisellaceae bacterium]
MKADILKIKISNYLHKNKISVSEFERKAGLKQSAVRNILYGKSKSPTIDTIQVIANELGLTVDMLLSKNSDNDDFISNDIVDMKIMKDTASKLFSELLSSGAEIDLTEIFTLLKESYCYSMKKGKVDGDFIEWMLNRRELC